MTFNSLSLPSLPFSFSFYTFSSHPLLSLSLLSEGNNTCFYGKCYYCRESEPACGVGESMEGSVTLWLPDVWPLQKHRHPWGRTYREGKLARYVFLTPV